MELNENDKKLLGFCSRKQRSVGELAKLLGIAPKNISVRLPKLEKAGYIQVQKQDTKGKKTIIYINDIKQVEKYIALIIKEFKEAGGDLSEEELMKLPKNIKINEDNWAAIEKAKAYLFFTFNDLIERRVKLTSDADKFLKEHKN